MEGLWLLLLVRPKDNPSEPDQFFLRIFDSFADPLAVYDQDFQILKVNQALLKFYQRSAEQLMGNHCYEIFHGRERGLRVTAM